MPEEDFKVEQIDHVHIFVPDQYQAADWYKRVLGLEILKEHEDWAVDGGPLTISSNEGGTSLALFKGEPVGGGRTDRHRDIAFRVSGAGFIKFLKRLAEHEIRSKAGAILKAGDVVDHEKAFSIYFCDPYGNPYELTTYDYDYVREHLKQAGA